MNVYKISIRNIMGVKEFELLPGKVTEISGSNGTGKTSIMNALQSAIGGGHNKFLISDGETEGEVVIELDDNTVIKKKISPEKSDLKVTIDDRAVSSPATLVSSLFGTGFNPVKFLNMTDKERTKEILKALPIPLDYNALDSITGSRLRGIDYMQHPLSVINDIHNMIYESRKGYNQVVTQLTGTVKTLEGSLVDFNADEFAKEVSAYNDKYVNLTNQRDKIVDKLHEDQDAIRKTLADKIEELRIQASKDLEDVANKHNAEISAISEELAALEKDNAVLREREAQFNKQAGIRTQLEKVNEDLKAAQYNSKREDTILTNLDAYKKALLEDVKIGPYQISIEDGKLKVDGLPYDNINTAAKVTIAVELAALNVGQARFCAIDGAECLDSQSLEYLVEEAKKKDLQLLLFSVVDGELTGNVIA